MTCCDLPSFILLAAQEKAYYTLAVVVEAPTCRRHLILVWMKNISSTYKGEYRATGRPGIDPVYILLLTALFSPYYDNHLLCTLWWHARHTQHIHRKQHIALLSVHITFSHLTYNFVTKLSQPYSMKWLQPFFKVFSTTASPAMFQKV